MKKFFKGCLKNPMVIVFILILIFFMPIAIYSPGENRNRGVVTAVGIDKVDELYEVSLLTFIPTANQTYKDTNSVISGKGKSVADAIYKAQIAMGRKVGLAHAKTTIVNEELLKEDVATHIDYLSRVASLPENTVFICSNKTAKEVLETSKTLESNVGLKLEQLIGFNANNLYVTDTSLEAFYKGYYSDVKSSIIGYLTIMDENEVNGQATQDENNSTASSKNSDGSSDSQGSGSGNNEGENIVSQKSVEQNSTGQSSGQSEGQAGGGGQSKSTSSKQILNQGEAVLLKNGKLVEKLSIEQLNGINLLNPKALNQIVTINDVKFEDKTLSFNFRIKNKKVLTSTKFENGIPIYLAQLILGLELVEIVGEHEEIKINTEFSEITPEIAKKLDYQIKKEFTDALKVLRENKTDVIGINDKFFRENRNSYLKYIDKIKEIDNFINFVNFKLSLIIQPD